MDNLLEMIRKRNLFGVEPENPAPMSPIERNTLAPDRMDMSPAPQDNLDPSSEYSKLLGLEAGTANKSYNDFLEKGAPNRADFKSTKMNKLAAILSGISEGIDKGGYSGRQAHKAVLDEPYNEAVSSYNLQGNRLEKAAGLEEKNLSNRRNVFKDVFDFNAKQADDKRQGIESGKRIENIDSQIANRRPTNPPAPYRFRNDITGNLEEINNGIRNVIGKVGETPEEEDKRIVERTGKTSSITEGRQKAIAEFRSKLALSNSQKRALEAAARDANNPNRAFSARALAAREVLSAHPDLADAIDLTTLIIQDKDADDNPIPEATRSNMQRLLDAAMQKYLKTAAPTASTEKVEMIDKNGKKWMVDPANVEAFKKANQ